MAAEVERHRIDDGNRTRVRGQALIRTATVLVIACPHALGMAIPLVIAISTTLGARNGLLITGRCHPFGLRLLNPDLVEQKDVCGVELVVTNAG